MKKTKNTTFFLFIFLGGHIERGCNIFGITHFYEKNGALEKGKGFPAQVHFFEVSPQFLSCFITNLARPFSSYSDRFSCILKRAGIFPPKPEVLR